MSDKVQITQQQVQSRASSQSFSRGQTLYNSGAISNTIQRDDTIEARCEGSYPEPYRVWAALKNSEIVSTGCNCEYDWGGDCKHIIALLLTYLHEPERFEERQTLQETLMSRDKEDLIDIIMLMITRYPDLQDMVDQPTPNEVIEGKATLDTLSLRLDLQNSFQNYGYDTYMDYPAASPNKKVSDIAAIAKRFSERGDWFNAAVVYRTILEEFAELDQDDYYDEDGDLAYEIEQVVLAMDDCLKQSIIINDDKERQAIFDALLGVYIWDINFGGIDIGFDAPEIILKHARREDISSIRQIVESVRDQSLKRQYGQWASETYNAFLTDLDTLDDVDPEVILERLRSQEMYQLLVGKLLDLQRVDEAAQVVREYIPGRYERIKALTCFIDNGHSELALEIAEEGLEQGFDDRVIHWLMGLYKKQNNQDKIFHWQQVLMAHQPLEETYKELKQIALALNQWDAIRPQIIADLQKREAFAVLTRVYLIDEEWALAWETLPKVENTYAYMQPLDLLVAQKSHHATPEQAIPVYIKYARKAIANRNRDQYAIAASMLATVQTMYDHLDEIEKWEHLISDIRTEFKTLRALKDELNKAGL